MEPDPAGQGGRPGGTGIVQWNEDRNSWEVSDYTLAFRVLRCPTLSANICPHLQAQLPPGNAGEFADLFEFLRLRLLSLAGDDHRQLHRQLTAFLTPKAMKGMDGPIAATARRILAEAVAAHGDDPWDFVAEVAVRLPLAVIFQALGIPAGDELQVQKWAADVEALF
eukprot:EG_transcript_20323